MSIANVVGRPLGYRKLLSLALGIGIGVAFIVSNVSSWNLEDMDAYWNAALRLRHQLPLYPPVPDAGAADVFRYSPWFAWLWIPLTDLPKPLVQVGWSAILLGSIPIAIVPMLRQPSVSAVCLAAIMAGLLFRTASTGNVQALVVAVLVHGVRKRSGPIWIGLAASLKVAPLGYALVYLGRREWGHVIVSLGVTAALLAPALFYDLRNYPNDLGDSFSLLAVGGPFPWAAAAAVWTLVAIAMARSRVAWGAASVAVLSLIPRLELYSLTYMLVGLGRQDDARQSRDQPSRLRRRARQGVPGGECILQVVGDERSHA